MGRNLPPRESKMIMDNHSPGCTWGNIFNQFHHNRWLNAKKRLPYRRNPPGKSLSPAGQGINKTNSEAVEEHGNVDSPVENTTVETKAKETSPPLHKNNSSKKSIKAIISKEMSKRKGRHRRSSSCPTRATTTTTIDKVSTPILEPNSPSSSCPNNVHKASSDHVQNSSCEWCNTMLNVHYLTQNEANSLGRHPVRDHTLLQDKCVYAIEPGKYASHQESKLFMDALDLLNMRKEVFLKILQDPSSSLANQLRSRRGPSGSRLGLKKSVSFPVSSSSSRRGLCTKPEEESQPFMTQDFNKHLKASSSTESLTTLQLSDKKRSNDNKLALKHFKNLKDKIKHVIRDRKKEKNRIIMDAVHHKIPYGRGDTPEIKTVSKYCHSIEPGINRMKRTTSFNESFDRYNRLLEISSNKEQEEDEKGKSFEKLRIKTRDTTSRNADNLVRIRSLPDLRAYSSFHNDDSPSYGSIHTTDTEQKPTGLARVGSDDKVARTSGFISESESRENDLLEAGETFEDSADSRTWETASSHDFSDLESVRVSDRLMLKSDPVSENCEASYQDQDAGEEVENSVLEDSSLEDSPAVLDIASPIDSSLETQVKQFYDVLMHDIRIDTKTEAQFNYVKDVLELSGFSRDEILGKWHSVESPLDPLMFEEVEGCSEESGGIYDHLLLFDLINEVLLDIYERSFSYWPVPLTTRSRVHRMPKGYHVLEEVWAEISWFLSWRPEMDRAIDDPVSRDLAKNDGWMNLQIDDENVGLELEDSIFDELLDEVVYS